MAMPGIGTQTLAGVGFILGVDQVKDIRSFVQRSAKNYCALRDEAIHERGMRIPVVLLPYRLDRIPPWSVLDDDSEGRHESILPEHTRDPCASGALWRYEG